MNPKVRPRVLVPRAEVASAVARLASQISRDYRDKNPLLIGVLKGSFVFMADLIRALDFPLEVDFVCISSYGGGKQSSGSVKVERGLRCGIRGRHVLIIEDIIDTGTSAAFLLDYFKKKRPASLKLCALMDKPGRRRVAVTIDYDGMTVPDKFLVGYGLDCNERYRNLPDVCVLEE
jgi:hypoxanthine phosphoribosyltransferase